jgi:hypothetical protein
MAQKTWSRPNLAQYIYSNICWVFGNVVSEPDSLLSRISFPPSIKLLSVPPATWKAEIFGSVKTPQPN